MTDVEKFIRFCETPFGDEGMAREAAFFKQRLRGRVLDVGCGIGAFEQRLPGLDIAGVDLDERMLEVARERTPNSYHREDATRLPFPDSSFDAVFSVTSMEFMGDYKVAVDEAARVLVPGGRVIAMLLNPESAYFSKGYEPEDSYFRMTSSPA